MKKKVNKITVGTRITIPLRDELQEEAFEYDLSFCAYLEYLLVNRTANTIEDKTEALQEDLQLIQEERDELMEQVDELETTIVAMQANESTETEHQDLLDRIQELENQVRELEEENDLLQTFDEEDTDSGTEDEEIESEEAIHALLDEIETEKEVLQSENETLRQQIDQLQVVAKQTAPNFNTDSLYFLQEKYPELSKEEIIKAALDCSATNEEKGWYQTVYSFTDYVNRNKSFINPQNN